MKGYVPKPSGGIGKDYAGSCVVCRCGTDTGLAFVGEAEWVAAGLVRLGIAAEEAVEDVEEAVQEAHIPGTTTFAATYRVCTDCAGKAGLSVGLLIHGGEIPAIAQFGR